MASTSKSFSNIEYDTRNIRAYFQAFSNLYFGENDEKRKGFALLMVYDGETNDREIVIRGKGKVQALNYKVAESIKEVMHFVLHKKKCPKCEGGKILCEMDTDVPRHQRVLMFKCEECGNRWEHK